MAAAGPLSECLRTVKTPVERSRLEKYLNTLPYPHYEPASNKPGFLARIEEDGRRTVGRFVNRQFQAGAPKKG
jgi:hypothetical protein